MPQFTQISTILRVPSENFSALTVGASLTTISRSFIRQGQQFIVVDSDFDSDSHESSIAYWAICESSQVIAGHYDHEYLSKATYLPINSVQQLLDGKANFLAFLRVYRIPIVTRQLLQFNKQFAALPSPIAVVDESPIISKNSFAIRKRQIENCVPSDHPELEELQSTIAHYAKDHPEAQDFSDDLQEFLGWVEPKSAIESFPNWIREITTSGNSSDGDLFEKRVRQAFIQLGFTNTLSNPKVSLDPDAAGGAGGIDFYCEFPYSIVGECKASKSLKVNDNKDGAPFQLIKLGQKYLNPLGFSNAIKIIMAPGELTKDANLTAIGNQMNIMRPETLQRLVELKIAHPGSIDLLELKPCLEAAPFGTDSDKKVNEFIDKIYQRLNIRSHLIQAVRALQDGGEKNINSTTIKVQFNAIAALKIGFRLNSDSITHSLLAELSSPLTGYLGKTKGNSWDADRFYFLRDLMV